LRQRLFQLKKIHELDIVCGQTTLALAADVTHDLDGSRHLLDNAGVDIGGEFGQWLAHQRERRLQGASQGLVDQIDQAQAAGDLAGALLHARELLALEPLSEHAHRCIMRLHYLAGDRAAALLAFDRCERVLKDEVGTRPSPETLALLATIEQALVAPTVNAPVPTSLLRPPRLIGRDNEWQSLLQAWDTQALMLVAGEPGMGKTRLLSDLALRYGSAAVLVHARPGDDSVPYALMARLMRLLLPGNLQLLALHHQQALARVLPEMGQAAPTEGLGALALREAFDALLMLAQKLGVVGVMLDDLHFADAASLDNLQALCASSPGLSWVLAYRPADLSPPALVLTQATLMEPRTRTLQLAPLDELAIAELVDSLGLGHWSGKTLAPSLLRHTGGNPLYLLETLKALLREGAAPNGKLPRASNVSHLIARRLAGLSPLALKIARCAAVAGQDFSPNLATQVLGKDLLDLADGWAELEAAQILRDAAFAHDLISDAALTTVPQALARRLHSLIAETLAAQAAAPQRVAAHWVASDAPHKAVPYLLESGQQAALAMRATEARTAYVKASELLADEGRDSDAFQALTAFLDSVYNPNEADVQEVLNRQESLAHNPLDKARLAISRADVLARSGDFVRSGATALAALEALDLHQQPALASRLTCMATTADLSSGRLDAAVERMYRAVDLANRSGDEEAIATASTYFGSVLDHAHRYAEAYLAHQHSLELAQKRGFPIEIIAIASNIATNRLQMGCFETALEMVQMAYRVASEAHVEIAAQWPTLVVNHGQALRGLGEYRQSIRVLEDAQVVFAQHMPAWLPGVHNAVAVLWMQLGQWARARQAIDASLMGSDNLPRYRARALLLLAEITRQLASPSERSLQPEIDSLAKDQSPLTRHQVDLGRALSLPPDDGYVLACRVRDQGLTAQMPSHVLEAEVRCATTAARSGRHALAADHAREALNRLRENGPTTMYIGEVWLAAAQALEVSAPAERAKVLFTAMQWIQDTAQHRVPEEFRDSFVHRNPANRELLALAKRLLA
jgi:tetratricopeptide (TPR) repeat protein